MPNFWSITLGNIITIAGGLGTLILLLWKTAQHEQRMESELTEIVSRLSKSELELDQMTKMGLITTISQHERRLQDVERIAVSVGRMETDVSWIKERLRNDKQNG